MKLDEYQERAGETAIYPDGLNYPILGLAGEAGELCNKYKKILRDKGGEADINDMDELAKELGDVLWYVAQIATELDTDLEVVARRNLMKLEDRQNRGVLGGSGDDR
jgi:NTP pyrophosphatase (non-canonical NTP hydrolase)